MEVKRRLREGKTSGGKSIDRYSGEAKRVEKHRTMCVRRQEEERRGEKRNIGQCVLGGRKRRGEERRET